MTPASRDSAAPTTEACQHRGCGLPPWLHGAAFGVRLRVPTHSGHWFNDDRAEHERLAAEYARLATPSSDEAEPRICPECGGAGNVLVEAPDGSNGADICEGCGGSGRGEPG